MLSQQILNSKEIKKLLLQLNEQFGEFSLEGFAILKNNEDKYFLISRKLGDLPTENIRVNNLGMYFCKQEKDGLRLSIEGAQFIKPTKNILELDKPQSISWMRGEDVEIRETKLEGYVILRFGKDILGCGKLKDGKIFNSVSKPRRVIGNISEDKADIRTIR
mgnify:FL=1